MEDQELIKLIRDSLGEVAPKKKAQFESITAETRIDSLGLDSIAVMEMVGYVEESLDLVFDDEGLSDVESIGDLMRLCTSGD